MAEGRLFYVIGPSGSGKDSLMRYARASLAGDPSVVFAHRYITRPMELHGENHVALTETEFDARLAAGLFAMHWESHGLRYGIGLIKLDADNPAESQVLIPARERDEIDWDMANRLATENRDFLDYVKLVKQFYQTGEARLADWDVPETTD